MGKSISNGVEIFRNALHSAGLGQEIDDFDDSGDEHDPVGEWAYIEEVAAD